MIGGVGGGDCVNERVALVTNLHRDLPPQGVTGGDGFLAQGIGHRQGPATGIINAASEMGTDVCRVNTGVHAPG